MKKIFLTIGIFVFSASVLAQAEVNSDELVGWWGSESKTRCQLFFWKDINGELQLQEISCKKNEWLVIRDYGFLGKSVYMRSSPNKHVGKVTYSQYTSLDHNSIYCESTDETTEEVTVTYYKRYR